LLLKLNFLCLKEVNVSFSVMITMDSWAPVVMYFQKRCYDPEIDVGTYQTGGLVPNIVHKNIVQSTIWEVPATEDDTELMVYIPKSYQSISPYQQFVLKSYYADLNFIDPIVNTPHGTRARPEQSPLAMSYIYIRFRCLPPPPEISTTRMNFTLQTGWLQEVTFEIIKHCNTHVDNGGGGSSSAWTPFGIFAFTVFLLILVWCLVGCAYNYVAKDQRGADAIPGITIYRAIYYRCFPAPKYTPQTDYNYDKDTADYGGGSYQSENL